MNCKCVRFLSTLTISSLLFFCTQLNVFAQSMQLIAPGTGWMLKGRLFWTIDDGTHWTDITPHASGVPTDVFFLDNLRGWVLFSDAHEDTDLISFHIASTIDSGHSWSVSSLKATSQKPDELDGYGWLDFADAEHGWVVLRAKSSSASSWGLLLGTDDGGRSWRELPQAPVAGRPDFVTPQDGWLSGPDWAGRYSTHDGGKSWGGIGEVPDSLGSASAHPYYGDVKFINPKQGLLPVWLSSPNDKARSVALALYVTGDGGRTWRVGRLLADSDIGSLEHVEDTITVPGGKSVILVAREKMHTDRLTLLTVGLEGAPSRVTSNLAIPEHDEVAEFRFADNAHGWASTRIGTLFSTKDGGATWQDVTPLPAPHPLPVSEATIPRRFRARYVGPGPSLTPQASTVSLHYSQRLGFDTHNVPAVDVMQTWWSKSPFFNVGIYVGGANYCGLKNPVTKQCISRPDPGLIPSWVTQVQAQGWGFMPLWIGPQAPCVNSSGFSTFTAANANATGAAEANSAAAAMAALGLGGSVVFYDMENYTDDAQHVCSGAVRAFLSAWVSGMQTNGYAVNAVYGNGTPAKNDFSQIQGLNQVWIAATPGVKMPPRVTIWGLGFPDTLWNSAQRAHQFLINIPSVKYGGTTADPKNPRMGHSPAIDYDMTYLELPGGNGTKPYVWTGVAVALPNAQSGDFTAINDMVNPVAGVVARSSFQTA